MNHEPSQPAKRWFGFEFGDLKKKRKIQNYVLNSFNEGKTPYSMREIIQLFK